MSFAIVPYYSFGINIKFEFFSKLIHLPNGSTGQSLEAVFCQSVLRSKNM